MPSVFTRRRLSAMIVDLVNGDCNCASPIFRSGHSMNRGRLSTTLPNMAIIWTTLDPEDPTATLGLVVFKRSRRCQLLPLTGSELGLRIFRVSSLKTY